MHGLTNMMRREAERAMDRKAVPCYGVVTSYDPDTYSAKVQLQPSNQETGFLPIHSPWSGNGWGMFAPPSPGDLVEVNFQEDGKNAGMIGLRQFGNQLRPLPVPSGEFWLVDSLGNSFKFTGGKLTLNGHTEIDVTAPTINVVSTVAVNVTTPTMTLSGNLIVDGNINATGNIIDNDGTNANNMASFRELYDAHKHNAPDGITSVPLAPDLL